MTLFIATVGTSAIVAIVLAVCIWLSCEDPPHTTDVIRRLKALER